MEQLVASGLDKLFTIEAHNVRELLGDYQRANADSLRDADFYPTFTLTRGARHTYRRGAQITDLTREGSTAYDVCADACTYIMTVFDLTREGAASLVMGGIERAQRHAEWNVAFPIHVVHVLRDICIVISDRPATLLWKTVREHMQASLSLDEVRAFAKKTATDVVDVTLRMFKAGVWSEPDSLAYDSKGRLRAVDLDKLNELRVHHDAGDANVLLQELNRAKDMVYQFALESRSEEITDAFYDAFLTHLTNARGSMMRQLSVMYTPLSQAGTGNHAHDPMEVLADRAVTSSRIQSVMTVHQCATDERECRLSDIIGEDRNPEVAALAKVTAAYLFRGTGCAHYKRGDKLGENTGHTPVFFSCCGTSCDHITKVIAFDGSEYTADTFVEEVKMQQLVYDIGLAPAINTAYLSSIGGVVVMDKLDRTVDEVIKTYLTNEFNTDERATMRVSQILSEEWGREWTERLKARARDIANEVADVLHRLHQHDLWHQDTHTGNFMYTRSGELKCIDFGRTKLIPRNQILKIETREPAFDQTPFEFEYFQFKRSMNALPNYFRNTFEGNTAKHFANEFKNAAKEVWALRRDDERREIEAL